MRTLPFVAIALSLAGCPSSPAPEPSAAAPARAAASASAATTSTFVAVPSGAAPAPEAPPAAQNAAAAAALGSKGLPNAVACPEDMVPTGLGGCIDRYEASMGPGALGDPQGKGTTVVPQSKAGQPPLVNVSQLQAVAMCKNAKKHLCDEKEWIGACQGPGKWEYTYGPAFEASRCRDWTASKNGTEASAPTGSYPACTGPFGAFDLTNNVGEWTSTPEKSGNYAVRGGTYNMTVHDSACDEDDYTVKAEWQSKDVGFRCCAPALAASAASASAGAAPSASAPKK
jgi:hypothetical protein